MNVRGAAVQSGLAALGLVVAYTTWQREPERAPGEVIVIDVNKSDVQSVRIDAGDKSVAMERRKDTTGEEPRVWLKLSADAKQKKPAREVPGNEGAERLWDKFGPLRATRALGTLKPDKLKELGLDAPKKHIEVTARGVKHTFAVGSSPFGVSIRTSRTSRTAASTSSAAGSSTTSSRQARGSSIARCTRSSRATSTASPSRRAASRARCRRRRRRMRSRRSW